MHIKPVSEWTLYKYRFGLSYLLLAVLVALYIGLQGDLMPPGLGPNEKESVVASANLNLSQMPTAIIDLPYHLAQKGSIQLFGVTPLGVRLPSLVFGGLTAVLLALVLRRWFKTNVAIVAALVVLSSAWFIATVRVGAPFVMVPFWTSLILLTGTYVVQETKHWRTWKLVLALTAALSLYTPFMVYLFVAALIAGLTQPHLRYLIKRASRFRLTLGALMLLIVLVPLGWGIYKDWQQIWQLLAIPQNLPGPLQFGEDLIHATSNLFNPYNVSFSETLTPLISLASAALLLMGAARLLKDAHSVRTHVLLIWGAVLLPVVALNPDNLVVLLVPAMLVMAIGVHLIISYWYRLFPRNPYARVFGLIPLAILIAVMVQFNNQRYVYGMMYSQQAATVFNNDAFLAQKAVKDLPAEGKVTLVVPAGEEPIYRLIAERRPNTAVMSGAQVKLSSGTWVVAESEVSKLPVPPAKIPSGLVVNDHKDQSLRFRIYQR